MNARLSYKLREEYRGLWNRNERPTGLYINPKLITQLANEYGSEDPWAVHWLLYGVVPIPDSNLEKWKWTSISWKPKEKQEHLLASVRGKDK